MPNSNNALHVALIKAADHFVTKMKQRLSSSDYPHGDTTGRGYTSIEDSIVIGQPVIGQDQASITIQVGGERAPFASAFEFGSGIHSTRGPSHTYVIEPKNKGALAFIWPGHDADFPRGLKYIGPGKDGKLLFQYVDHPGIKPVPFIQPTITEELEAIKRIVGQEVKIEILRSVREGINGSTR